MNVVWIWNLGLRVIESWYKGIMHFRYSLQDLQFSSSTTTSPLPLKHSTPIHHHSTSTPHPLPANSQPHTPPPPHAHPHTSSNNYTPHSGHRGRRRDSHRRNRFCGVGRGRGGRCRLGRGDLPAELIDTIFSNLSQFCVEEEALPTHPTTPPIPSYTSTSS